MNQAAQAAVKKDEVDTKPSVVDTEPALATEERKSSPNSQEEVHEVPDQRFL